MASQKFTNCCVAAIALVTAAYISTPHSSTIARLAFGAFCLAIHSFAKTLTMAKQKFRPTRLGVFLGAKAYIQYVEILKKRRNAVSVN
jgi:hypothetical protein